MRSCVWQRLPDAPGPARAGAALALSRSRLYRFGGEGSDDDDYDGEQATQQQQGGQLDFLELGVDCFDDQVTGGGVEAVLWYVQKTRTLFYFFFFFLLWERNALSWELAFCSLTCCQPPFPPPPFSQLGIL